MNNNSAQADHSPSSLCPWHWGWSAALALIVLVTLAFRYALPVRDGDLWFHMLYGKYFLEHQTLIADHTIFSWTPTTNDTIYVTWLPDIFLYLLHKAAGLPGIFAFRYLCMLVPVAGCYLYARKMKIVTHPLTWLLCLLAVIMSYTAAFEKPEILSFVFMTLLAWNWWHIRSSGEEAWQNCYLFPVIMLVWVNTHGGFIFGAVFLVLIGIGELLNTWLSPQNVLSPQLRKHLLIALLLSAITPLLTPYHYRYPAQLFLDLMPTQENLSFNNKIAAYGSPFLFDDVYGIKVCADIVVVLLLLLYLRNFKKIEWTSLLTNLVFAYLYTRYFRTTFYWIPIFLFSGLSLLAINPVVSCAWKYGRFVVRILPALTLGVSLWLSGLSLYNAMVHPEKWLWTGFGISDANPVAEADYIKKYFPAARIGNTYDQGAYLLWKLWPQNRIFFDARHFPYRNWSDEFFLYAQGKDVQQLLKKYPCDVWCVGLGNLPLAMSILNSGEWQLAFYGRSAAIMVRKGIPLPDGPKVSAEVYAPKNLACAIDSLKFACYVKDWPTAARIHDAMNKRFTYRANQKGMIWANRLYLGFSAFYSGNYRDAVKHLSAMRPAPTIVHYILASSHLFLLEEAWQRGDTTSARRHAERALQLTPNDNPYALYNLGTIVWNQERSGSNEENRPDWRRLLSAFLQTAPLSPEFNVVRPMAQAMLDGEDRIQPQLLIPPKPTSKQTELSGSRNGAK